MFPDRKRISPPEAATYIGMSESWLSKSRMTGMDAPRHFKIGRRVVYDTADLDTWLAVHHRMNTSEPPQAHAAPAERGAPFLASANTPQQPVARSVGADAS